MTESREDLRALYEAVLEMCNDITDPEDRDEAVATVEAYYDTPQMLRFVSMYVADGWTVPFNDACSLVYFLLSKFEEPANHVTESRVQVYGELSQFMIGYTADSQLRNQYRDLLVAAALSGVTDIGLIKSIMLERKPVTGDDLLSVLSQVESAHPSLGSGVL